MDPSLRSTRLAGPWTLRPRAHAVQAAVIPGYGPHDAGGTEGPGISYKQADKDWKKANAEGQAALDRTASPLGTDAQVPLVPDDETTGEVIDRVASEINADVLVVGATSKGWLRASDYAAHHAPCPVMLIRQDH